MSDIEGNILGKPDMEDVESLTSDKEDEIDEAGNIIIKEGGTSAKTVEHQVNSSHWLYLFPISHSVPMPPFGEPSHHY